MMSVDTVITCVDGFGKLGYIDGCHLYIVDF